MHANVLKNEHHREHTVIQRSYNSLLWMESYPSRGYSVTTSKSKAFQSRTYRDDRYSAIDTRGKNEEFPIECAI
jgi:hypothetical protein